MALVTAVADVEPLKQKKREKKKVFQGFSKIVTHRGLSAYSHEYAEKNIRLMSPVVCENSCGQGITEAVTRTQTTT